VGSWNRTVKPILEMLAYASLVPVDGGALVGRTFYLYYTYLYPGQDFGQRYIVRHKVDISVASEPVVPNVKQAITRYLSSNPFDYWCTTKLVPNNYKKQTNLGYSLATNYPETVQLYDCYIEDTHDHFIAFKEV